MQKWVILSAVTVLLAAPACPRRSARRAETPPDASAAREPSREIVRIEHVAVEVAAWPPEAGARPDPVSIASRMWETFSQSSDFETAGRRIVVDAAPFAIRRRARLRAEIGVEREAGRLRGAARLSVTWVDDDSEELAPWSAAACAGDEPNRVRLPAAAMALVECAVDQAARGLAEKQAIRCGDQAAVLRAIDSDDPSLRQVAYATIAERRMRSAVPRLLEALGSHDEFRRDGAIGALVALREPRAVTPLIELAQFKDLDMMRRIIDAVGAIGGDNARAYLELVASGHDVPAVRELASAALQRLQRRAALDGGD